MNKHIWGTSTSQSKISVQATNCFIHSPLQCLFHSTQLFLGRVWPGRLGNQPPFELPWLLMEAWVPQTLWVFYLSCDQKKLLTQITFTKPQSTKKESQGYSTHIPAFCRSYLSPCSPCWARPPPGWGQAHCHSFPTLDCSKQTQEVLDKRQMVRERKSVSNTSLLHNASTEPPRISLGNISWLNISE